MKLFQLSVFILILSNGMAQENQITVKGRVYDIFTGKGVKASIQYSSLPTGGIYGKFVDSVFTFKAFGAASYKIEVKAINYNKSETILTHQMIASQKSNVPHQIGVIPNGVLEQYRVIFEQGKSSLTKKAEATLTSLALALTKNKFIEIELEGHTDDVGGVEANSDLSKARVEEVKKYLVSKGVNKKRIKSLFF